MPISYGFHPEALFDYAEGTNYLLREASARVAESFVSSVESAVATVVADPTRWRVIDEPDIRRFVLSRFPFVIYYRWEPSDESVTIFAVMHCSREPSYWRHRIEQSAHHSEKSDR
jgi:plasmid stabilization system protein ParE